MSELTEFRKEKDEFFARHPQSPLTPEQRRDLLAMGVSNFMRLGRMPN